MSLKRRNLVAWVLLLAAALCLSVGRKLSTGGVQTGFATTSVTMSATGSIMETTEVAGTTYIPTTIEENDELIYSGGESIRPANRGIRFAGYALVFAGAAAGVIAVFALRQTTPLLGPDGSALLSGLMAFLGWAYFPFGLPSNLLLHVLLAFGILWISRELWGWIRAKLSLSWSGVSRIAGHCKTPRLALLVLAADVCGAVVGVLLAAGMLGGYARWTCVACVTMVGLLGVGCLWRYGSELGHFQTQLDCFENGQPISVQNGAFSKTEEQLVRMQQRQAEAIETAVTSERFKVELISNVSHDLRTPLTAILGYGELLQQETLSPAGQEQLARLNLKAGYMRDLVESLFELTKVSSGVTESRKVEIDLIRLLEQTIGLFDDQLTAAGLQVRRHYEADTLPVTTDGARMHQVFANLLGNAIKYALPGTRIHLEVRTREDSYLIRMVNTASYEMDFQPEEIIQRFARGDKARSTQGSGLGLAIAQTYTESVGGAFRVAIDGDQFSAIVTLPKTERNL